MCNTTDRQFKKTKQVVGCPAVTDHDIHKEYMRDPPNVPSAARDSRGLKEENAQVADNENLGVIGHHDAGRAKQSEVLCEVVRDNSIHP
ncbi:hypothetical protein FIBSPDRAFT_729245 [Athelia psychrophila]|uniref:Uncharacterized protein n=1 Tax=Athelia psychrophila TaxID=1759441 RepID=A0A166RJV3_9AGAM|nr:hypothetical protein FIBSPDRAFT_729245 [Fibularhizoctonia sp. CBS 109695]